MEYTCPACKDKLHTKKTFNSRTGKDLEVIFCNNCGHGSQIIKKNYDIYSSGEFSKIARNQASSPSREKIKALDKKALTRYQFYKKHFREVHSALEVGSSIGSFVHLLKLSGIVVQGIEPDSFYAEFSKSQYGFDQKSVLFENYHPNEKFDIIYSFHVIEHVPDPESYIKKTYDLLEKNGKILIECPSWDLHSFGDVKFTIWEPHLQYFTLSSIYALLSRNGFRVKEINFIGSALYAVGIKDGEASFNQNEFKKYKRRYLNTSTINTWMPKIPIQIKGTEVSKLVLQYLQSKNNRSTKEILFLSQFAIKNIFYLKKEKGLTTNIASHVSYYSGWENAGDTVLSKCVRKTINNSVSKNGWNLIKLTDPVTEKVIKKINRSQYLLIGGGGVLLPDSNPNSISGWQWAIDPSYWKMIKVPVIVFAIGYNFFKGQKNSDLFISNLERLVERADFFSLRNHGSISKVKEILPQHLHEKLVFQPCPTTIIRQLYPSLPSKQSTKKVGINVAFDRYERRFGENIYLILDQIAIALKAIEIMGYQIINVCHLETDGKFEIALDRRDVRYQTTNLQFMLPSEVYRFYNGIEIMIGMRGHAQMIPFGLNSKIISLGSHEKMRYFLEDIHSLDWYIDVNESPETLSSQIQDKFNLLTTTNKEEAEKRILEQQNMLFQTTLNNLKVIQNIL